MQFIKDGIGMSQLWFVLLVLLSFLIVGCGENTNALNSADPTAPVESTVATIAELELEWGDLSVDFDSEVSTYSVQIPTFAASTMLIQLGMDEDLTVDASITAEDADSQPQALMPMSFGNGGIALEVELPEFGGVNRILSIEVSNGLDTVEYSIEFERLTISDFSQVFSTATLPALIAEEIGSLGYSFDYYGDKFAIGIPHYNGEDSEGNTIANSGAVAVLSRGADDSWSAELVQPPAEHMDANDNFGSTVAINRHQLIVGAPNEDGNSTSTLEASDNDNPDSGAVFIFREDAESGSWQASHYIKAFQVTGNTKFGAVIDLFSDMGSEGGMSELVVGSYNLLSVFALNYRKATEHANEVDTVVFDHSLTLGGIKASLEGHTTLALSSNFLVLGLPLQFNFHFLSTVEDAGAVTIYSKEANGTYSLRQTFSGTRGDENLGAAVALDGYRIAASAPTLGGGAVHVYEYRDTDNDGGRDAWVLEQTIIATNTIGGDQFGESLALKGNTLIIGATGNDGGSTTTIDTVIDTEASGHINNSGAYYIYRRQVDPQDATVFSWQFHSYHKAPDASAGDNFGEFVMINDDGTVAVSAPSGEASEADQGENIGVMYLYR